MPRMFTRPQHYNGCRGRPMCRPLSSAVALAEMCHDRIVMGGEAASRTSGMALTVLYATLIGWMYVRQPQTMAQFTGGLSSAVGAYHVDQQSFDDGLAFFRRDQFVEAR